MSNKAKFTIDKNYTISNIDNRLYGSFIEHMGRAVYTGIYEPGHSDADSQGFRRDVIKAIKQLNVPIVRYPGGNFVSGYDWTDGIGPVNERPKRLDLAWFSEETNEIGIDEFVDWCKKADTEAMAAVNLGTGSPKEAGNMVEYCNHKGGTYWSDLRIKNGHKDPHNIKLWCLGNEMDGSWQICQMNSDDYGKKAKEAAKIMKWVDPEIELVACGSSGAEIPTFPEWDRKVLEHTYEHVDYISLHRYYELKESESDFLASHVDMDMFIKTIVSTADYVKAFKRSKKTMNLSFDEWNVWYIENGIEPHERWKNAPVLCEDEYHLLDALVLGGLLCSLVNNSDRVKIACLAQLVNTISPIQTKKDGGLLKKTTFFPFEQVSNYGRGKVLQPIISSPKIGTDSYVEIPALKSAVTYNEEDSTVSVFVLNQDTKNTIETEFDLRSFGDTEVIEHVVLSGEDMYAKNTFENPDNVVPEKQKVPIGDNGIFTASIKNLSWNMIRFKCK